MLSVDPKNQRLRLSFRTSKAAARETLAPGSIVACSISGINRHKDKLTVDVNLGNGATIKGVVPFIHLSDHAETCAVLADDADAVEARFPVGTDTEYEAVVVESARGVNVLSLKDRLIEAARDGSLPKTIEEVHPGQDVVGFVCGIASFGVFVRFCGRLSGLAPRANVADHWVTDVNEEFTIGQTVCTRIVDVDLKSNKISLNLKASIFGVGGALFTRSLIAERVVASSCTMDDGMRNALSKLRMGTLAKGTVSQIREFGLIISLEGGVAGFCMTDHTPKGDKAVSEGDEVECCVLDVDWGKKVADVSLRTALVQGAKERPKAASLSSEKATAGCVELVKSSYAIVSIPSAGNALAVAAMAGYNGKPKGFDGMRVGIACKVMACSDDEGNLDGVLNVAMFVPDELIAQRRPRSRSGSIEFGSKQRVRLELGALVRARVRDVSREWIELLPQNLKSGKRHPRIRAHMLDVDAPMSNFSHGDLVQGRVIAVDTAGGKKVGTLTLRKSDEELSSKELQKSRPSWDTIAAGQTFRGKIGDFLSDGVWAFLAHDIRGKVFCTDITTDVSVLNELFSDDESSKKAAIETHFPYGKCVTLSVKHVDVEAKYLSLAIVSV